MTTPESLPLTYRRDGEGFYVDIGGRCVGYIWRNPHAGAGRWTPIPYGDEKAAKDFAQFNRTDTRAAAARHVFRYARGFAPDGWRIVDGPVTLADWLASDWRADAKDTPT